jgi:hypothetical protein
MCQNTGAMNAVAPSLDNDQWLTWWVRLRERVGLAVQLASGLDRSRAR